ncbi:MAG: ADP-heptose:LPS heptosyltransferase [Synergistales bacterium 54_24]|nr:MAG: ADP-heptose:LPS heptosyltransferase [Synergistales bacterium 54_24]
MLEPVRKWPFNLSGSRGNVVLYRVSPQDYPSELYLPWYEDPIYKKLKVESLLFYIGGMALGDTVMINPTLAAFRGAFPGARFYIVGHPAPPVVRLLEEAGLMDELLWSYIPKHRLNSFPKYVELWRYGRRVGRIDLLVDTQRQFVPSLVLSFVFRYRRRLGYSCKGFFSDWRFPEPGRESVHDSYQSLMLARRLGIPPADPFHRLVVPPRIEELSERLVASRGWGEAVALFPLTAKLEASKCMPRRFYVDVARMIARDRPVLLFGSPSQVARLEEMADEIGGHVHIPYLESGVGAEDELFLCMALLRRVSAAVSNDSGGAHLAAALGTRTLVVAPMARLVRFGPCGERAWAVQTDLPCFPCSRSDAGTCKGDRWCLRAISPSMVVEALEKWMWV